MTHTKSGKQGVPITQKKTEDEEEVGAEPDSVGASGENSFKATTPSLDRAMLSDGFSKGAGSNAPAQITTDSMQHHQRSCFSSGNIFPLPRKTSVSLFQRDLRF